MSNAPRPMLHLREKVISSLSYTPETGDFTWKISPSQGVSKGSRAGCDHNGYIRISLEGNTYLAHRIAWVYHYGVEPGGVVDHINRVRNDNRIANLRVVSLAENAQNIAAKNVGSSGYPGVSFYKKLQKFHAQISVKNKKMSLGYFERAEDAFLAYQKAKEDCHPFHNGEF